MSGTIEAIYVAAASGAPMQRVALRRSLRGAASAAIEISATSSTMDRSR